VAQDTASETAVAPERASELIGSGAEVIDVRRSYEWEAGRIEGARHVEVNELQGAAESIARDRPVIFYCRTGNRSALAASAFRQAGWDAYNLDGGFRRRAKAQTAAHPTPPTEVAAKGTAESQPAAAGVPAAAAKTPAPAHPRPDPHERIDGLRAWLAQLDRKVGVRTFILAALAVLALAAAAVALVLAVQLKQDAATKDDVSSLRDQLTGVQESATQAAQSGVRSLNQRLTDLETKVDRISSGQRTTKRELRVIQGDIKELRSQTSSPGGPSGTAPSTGP
jgi:rhodanese-related sulfurtransferase